MSTKTYRHNAADMRIKAANRLERWSPAALDKKSATKELAGRSDDATPSTTEKARRFGSSRGQRYAVDQ